MARRCKCRTCKTALTVDIAYKVMWEGKVVYFCNKIEADEWLNNMKKEKEETALWDECYMFIKFQVLEYSKEQNLPRNLVTRLQDLRNGVMFQMNRGRMNVEKSKEGYPYPVITQTFKTKLNDIKYYFRTKQFANEGQKLNYMMAIIEGSINDEYIKYKVKQEYERKQREDNTIMINENDCIAMEVNAQKTKTKDETKKPSLMDFINPNEW